MKRIFFRTLDALLYMRHAKLVFSFRRRVGYWPRITLPVHYHEKYLWRKLFDHDPRFTECADKLLCKERVRRMFPDLKVAETLWAGDDPRDIPDAALSGDCVVKANHGSGWNMLVHGGKVDRAELIRRADKWMNRRYYGRGRGEWAYKHIRPRLFVEEMVMSGGRPVDREYKCYVAGGRILYVFMKIDRHGESPADVILDEDGIARDTLVDRVSPTMLIPRPEHFDTIAATALRMGAGFDFVRVDLYEADGVVWFSEFTFYPLSGYSSVGWPELEDRIDRAWDLRRSWFMTTPQHGWRKLYAARLGRTLDAADLA
ncbi:ATP-grasp fold amidoligase family protein [Oricola sp.]|uniref:ATP-grasp fold amidoligase family protein n=1 Tax=Oricola sp. TaxID=1979950 RepID=UPI0025FCF628|nr:ATP-grasp fold amidoligase family protein [Oricola sp.]MCI5075741.1 hypothetical protein [Oricola sp.]